MRLPPVLFALILCAGSTPMVFGKTLSFWLAEQPARPRLQESFAKNPAPYRHVEVVPMIFCDEENFESELPPMKTAALGMQVGRVVTEVLESVLKSKGYEVRQPVRMVCADDDWQQISPGTRDLMVETRSEFMKTTVAILENSDKEARTKLDYKMGTRLDDLKKGLRMDSPDAIIYLVPYIGVYSRYGQASLGVVQLHFGMIDAKTRELLWWHVVQSIGPRGRADIESATNRLLVWLPAQKSKRGK